MIHRTNRGSPHKAQNLIKNAVYELPIEARKMNNHRNRRLLYTKLNLKSGRFHPLSTLVELNLLARDQALLQSGTNAHCLDSTLQ